MESLANIIAGNNKSDLGISERKAYKFFAFLSANRNFNSQPIDQRRIYLLAFSIF